MEETITISVGEKKILKPGFMKWIGLVYCGMPNENTFSLSYMETAGYQGYALNIYYPKSMSKIKIKNVEFNVLSVTPEKITLQQIKNLSGKNSF
ncbi:hypothetical protein FP803_04270 [Candidatus Woesearchaeota archaeon]|nr:hypothetical protein [Candidatus Woesearchaeota archaeon]MBU3942013.1 hypothetical protein [Nanoarchaeota archaeon]